MVTIGQRRSAQRGRSSRPCACARRDAACDRRSLCVRTRTAVAGSGRRARDLRDREDDARHRDHSLDRLEEAARRGQHAPPDAPGRPDRAGRRPPRRSPGVDRRRDRGHAHLGRIRRRGVGRGAPARGRGGRGRRPGRDPLRAARPSPSRWLGAMRAGAVAVPVAPGEVAAVVARCAPRVLVADGPASARRHHPRSARSGRARGAVRRGRRRRGPRAAAAHLRRPGRVPVAPRGAGQPGPGGGAAPGAGHARGPRAADPAPLPRLRAGGRSVPGLLGRGDRRAARSRAARRRRPGRRGRAAPGERAGRRARRPTGRCSSSRRSGCGPRWPACGCARAAGCRCRGRGRRPSTRRPGTASSRATG